MKAKITEAFNVVKILLSFCIKIKIKLSIILTLYLRKKLRNRKNPIQANNTPVPNRILQPS